MQPPIKIGITQGDPSGIGPEVTVKALAKLASCNFLPVLIGIPEVFQNACQAADLPEDFFEILSGEDQLAEINSNKPVLLPIQWDEAKPRNFTPGELSPEAGEAAWIAIEAATRLAMLGKVDGICTAPIHKAAMSKTGIKFPGHTENLQLLTQSPLVAMCMIGGGLRVVPLTHHIPLRQVPSRINEQNIFEMLVLLNQETRLFGIENPRIGVAGLNPHAGDFGLLGREDQEIIVPAIERAQRKSINALGPVPGDIIFRKMLDGHYDMILAMYHDQALIPVKTLDFDGGVNVTLGMPFIRTSPDHGTAHDIAGKNIANPASTISALNTALELIQNKIK